VKAREYRVSVRGPIPPDLGEKVDRLWAEAILWRRQHAPLEAPDQTDGPDRRPGRRGGVNAPIDPGKANGRHALSDDRSVALGGTHGLDRHAPIPHRTLPV
jgi:hypothetical protein